MHATVTVWGEGQLKSLPAVSTISVQLAPPPILQLGGSQGGVAYQTTYYIGGPPVPVVDPGFSITAPQLTELDGASVLLADIRARPRSR